MAGSEKAPRCNAEPPNLKLGVDLLRELLAIEQGRLNVATRIEEERNLVFPETTVIIRDIQKLAAAIEAAEKPEAGEVDRVRTAPALLDEDMGTLLAELAEEEP